MLYNYNWEEQSNSIFSTIENLLYRGLEDIREKHNNKNKHIDDKPVNPHELKPSYLKMTEAEEKILNDKKNQ